ncbi:MAG: DUF3014 domain-containing protein [Acidobacteriota bacterium]
MSSREALSPLWIAVLIIALIGLSVLAFRWFTAEPPAPMPAEQRVPANSANDPVPGAGAADERRRRPEMPPLDASDAVVRELASTLTEHPKLAAWLVPDDLVRKLVATVDNIARGDSPRPHLKHMVPEGPFEVEARPGGGLRVAESSYRRYDLVTEVFTSLDIGATVRLYYDMEPLFDEAWAELGDPRVTFRESLAQSIDLLMEVPIPEGSPSVDPKVSSYVYSDPALEQRTEAEKHLLRLGPENARKVQTKLRFLRAALDLDG